MAAISALVEALSDRSRFQFWTCDTVRTTDIDFQGHVNNTVFPVFFGGGRHSFLQGTLRSHVDRIDQFALVKITIEYLRELHYPGQVDCGTLIVALGRSSLTIGQALFAKGECIAVAESIMVLLDRDSRRAKPWPEKARVFLKELSGGKATK